MGAGKVLRGNKSVVRVDEEQTAVPLFCDLCSVERKGPTPKQNKNAREHRTRLQSGRRYTRMRVERRGHKVHERAEMGKRGSN